MKRGTPHHRKMRDLARALSVPVPYAVGTMEMLWHYAAQAAPQGDIGVVEDFEIAAAVGWEKRPAVLIEALVSTGWLERHAEYRLIVHDWPDHCEQSVKKWLDRNQKDFLPVYGHPSGQRPEKAPDIDQRSVRRSRGASAKAEAKAPNGESEGVDPDAVSQVRQWLFEFMGEQWPMPDADIGADIFRAMNGASIEDLGVYLRQLHKQGRRPEKSWAWFVPVVRKRFEGGRDGYKAAV